ncbi:MAG TPA: HdeD family acid-resistance protein [Microcoleaceae cyanobacterium]|jgi:uncharacterized membrane protein HdeD (DUF308 family)
MRTDLDPNVRQELQQGLGWTLALGILIAVLGVAAIVFPIVSTVALTLFFGWLFIAGGIFKAVYAFQVHGVGSKIWRLVLAALYVGAGIFMLTYPLKGALTLTVVLAVTILVESVLEVIMAFQLRPAPNWGWMLISGVLGIVLGILIWNQLPINALWIIGLLVGINLLMSGLWITMFSLSARRALRSVN